MSAGLHTEQGVAAGQIPEERSERTRVDDTRGVSLYSTDLRALLPSSPLRSLELLRQERSPPDLEGAAKVEKLRTVSAHSKVSQALR